MSTRLRIATNLVLFCATIVINGLSNALPFNGLTQQQLSKMYPILLTPATYVFAIWGLIYGGLLAAMIYQALPGARDDPRVRSLDLPFALACLCNIGWIFAWHYLMLTLSVLLMLGLLSSLILAYIRLDRERGQRSTAQRWILEGTFSLYLAWVCLATILNISIWLYTRPWRGEPLSELTWAALLLFVALGLFLLIALPRRDTAFLGVLLWASFGIQARGSTPTSLAIVAWVVFTVAALAAAWTLWTHLRPRPSDTPLLSSP